MPEREEYSQKRCGMECKGASLVNFELYETIYSTGRHFFGAIELLLVSHKPSLHDEQVHWSCVVRTGDPLCAKTLSARRPARIIGLSQLSLHTVITGCVAISHLCECIDLC